MTSYALDINVQALAVALLAAAAAGAWRRTDIKT